MIRCHRDIPPHFRGATPIFWVFQVVRDYARTLREDGSRMAGRLDDLLGRAAHLESAVGPVEIVFGHNDLLAANFIDDGDRIWLIDWEYAGFNSPLFDLGGLASNNELDADQERWLIERYFAAPPGEDRFASYAAMKCASLLREAMWSMVSELHSGIDFDYAAYTGENLERFERAWGGGGVTGAVGGRTRPRPDPRGPFREYRGSRLAAPVPGENLERLERTGRRAMSEGLGRAHECARPPRASVAQSLFRGCSRVRRAAPVETFLLLIFGDAQSHRLRQDLQHHETHDERVDNRRNHPDRLREDLAPDSTRCRHRSLRRRAILRRNTPVSSAPTTPPTQWMPEHIERIVVAPARASPRWRQ